jgi:diketogulonate reductase-like aldo/keto reductase
MAHIDTPIPEFKLNDGHSIPVLAYGTGTALFKRSEESVIDRTIVESVKVAAKLGFNHFDAAEGRCL